MVERRLNPIRIEELLAFETMLSNLSARFVELPADQIDRRIEEGLGLISDVLQIDRCAVAQLNPAKTELRITHSFARLGIRSMPTLILNEQQPWLSRRLLRRETVVMSHIDDLPMEAIGEWESTMVVPITRVKGEER
jgi:formate hydrogenlyase transcriptional activator